MLKKNIDQKGRILRFSIGSLLLIAALYFKSWILGAFALFTFFEAYMSWCLFFQLIGRNECPIDKK